MRLPQAIYKRRLIVPSSFQMLFVVPYSVSSSSSSSSSIFISYNSILQLIASRCSFKLSTREVRRLKSWRAASLFSIRIIFSLFIVFPTFDCMVAHCFQVCKFFSKFANSCCMSSNCFQIFFRCCHASSISMSYCSTVMFFSPYKKGRNLSGPCAVTFRQSFPVLMHRCSLCLLQTVLHTQRCNTRRWFPCTGGKK